MELEFLKKIVIDASKLINTDFEVYKKGNKSDLVTNLDLKIEKYLINKINECYPNYNIVSEEYNNNNKESDNCFIIDPIDGTVNFANGLPLWGIQVACKKEGKMIASVIYLPVFNELYYADENNSYLNGKKIEVKKSNIENSIYIVDIDDSEKVLNKIKKTNENYRFFNCSCVSFSYLACGKVNGLIFKKAKVWDYEPGLLLCKNAGTVIKQKKDYCVIASDEAFLNFLIK